MQTIIGYTLAPVSSRRPAASACIEAEAKIREAANFFDDCSIRCFRDDYEDGKRPWLSRPSAREMLLFAKERKNSLIAIASLLYGPVNQDDFLVSLRGLRIRNLGLLIVEPWTYWPVVESWPEAFLKSLADLAVKEEHRTEEAEEESKIGMARFVQKMRDNGMHWRAIAVALNSSQALTPTGILWSGEALKKFWSKHKAWLIEEV
jgi:hypothetical protein